jgi:hypothetical protein
MYRFGSFLRSLLMLVLCLAAGALACSTGNSTREVAMTRGMSGETDGNGENAAGMAPAHAKRAAYDFSKHFTYMPVKAGGELQTYDLPLGEGAVTNWGPVVSALALTSAARDKLLTRGFVVTNFAVCRQCDDMVAAYEALQMKEVPALVTAGSLLHTFHVLFDDLLRLIEAEHLYNEMWSISSELLEHSMALYRESEGDLGDAAGRNAAFLAVGLALLAPEPEQVQSGRSSARFEPAMLEGEFQAEDMERYAFDVPSEIASEVEAEVELISGHQGFAPSPVFIYEEDYSQYVPRGHYTSSEKLKNYFRAMMWFGRMSMLLKGSESVEPGAACTTCDAILSRQDARIQTLGALIIARAMGERQHLMAAWERVYGVTSFFVGLSDDLGPYEYMEAMNLVLGESPDLAGYSAADHGRLKARLAEYGGPRIFGGTGGCTILPPIRPEQADECLAKTRGFRLMGQRYVPDSYILSQLVVPHVGSLAGGETPFTGFPVPGVGIGRVFPRGLDVMAVMGSDRASGILDQIGDSGYRGFDRKLDELKAEIGALDESTWNQNLYWNWLWTLKALLAQSGPGLPAFMQGDVWEDRLVTQALASWAELRHDTILYVKQSYTALAAGIPPMPEEKPTGYVEPLPEVYNRLASLTRMMRLGLADMGVLDHKNRHRLQRLEGVLDRLIAISLVELEGRRLSPEDASYVEEFAEALEGVLSGLEPRSRKTTLIADVHTDANTGKVLEEGVGFIDLIVVAWSDTRGVHLAAGPELSYYEFKQPMSDRLTDEAWTRMLEAGPPERPEWVGSYSTF